MISEIKIQTLRKGMHLACLTEEEVCKLGAVNTLEELDEDRYFKCLVFLVNKARKS